MPKQISIKDAEKAKQAITATQLKKLEQLYNDWADAIAEKAKEYNLMKNPSSIVSEMQMQELEKILRANAQAIANNSYKIIKDGMYNMSDAMVGINADWLKSLGFTDEGISIAFSSVNNNVVQNILSGNIYDGGWNLSKSIWGDNEDTLARLHQVIAGGVAQGKSVYEMSKDIESFVRPGRKKNWNLKDKDGVWIYPKAVDYNAQRLVRTLVQHSYQQSVLETTKDNPFIMQFKWYSNGSRVCEICKERDGNIYTAENLPMDHPNGMCIIEPLIDGNIEDKLVDWFWGKDGDFPEIDKFAQKFGYNPILGNKEKVLKIKTPTFTKWQKQFLEPLGINPGEEISYYRFRDMLGEYDNGQELFNQFKLIHSNSLYNKDGLTMKDFFDKYIGKVKYKMLEQEKQIIKDLTKESLKKLARDLDDYKNWIDIIKENDFKKIIATEKDLLDLADNLKNGLKSYTTEDYFLMNGYLRAVGNGLSHEAALLESGLTNLKYKKMLRAIEGLNKLKVQEDMILRRGATVGDLAGLFMKDKSGSFESKVIELNKLSASELNKMFSGSVGEYDGFVSTSSQWNRGFRGKVEIIFNVKKGTTGSSITNISKYGDGEGEFLLPPGTKVICKKIEKSDGHKNSDIRVFMDVLFDE